MGPTADRRLGPASTIAEGGTALRFELAPGCPAFVIRFQGQCHAFVNRCPHRGTELDWEPGAVFSDDGQHLVCATHDAHFAPDTGLCVSGPCRGEHLIRLELREVDDGLLLIHNSVT